MVAEDRGSGGSGCGMAFLGICTGTPRGHARLQNVDYPRDARPRSDEADAGIAILDRLPRAGPVRGNLNVEANHELSIRYTCGVSDQCSNLSRLPRAVRSPGVPDLKVPQEHEGAAADEVCDVPSGPEV